MGIDEEHRTELNIWLAPEGTPQPSLDEPLGAPWLGGFPALPAEPNGRTLLFQHNAICSMCKNITHSRMRGGFIRLGLELWVCDTCSIYPSKKSELCRIFAFLKCFKIYEDNRYNTMRCVVSDSKVQHIRITTEYSKCFSTLVNRGTLMLTNQMLNGRHLEIPSDFFIESDSDARAGRM